MLASVAISKVASEAALAGTRVSLESGRVRNMPWSHHFILIALLPILGPLGSQGCWKARQRPRGRAGPAWLRTPGDSVRESLEMSAVPYISFMILVIIIERLVLLGNIKDTYFSTCHPFYVTNT